MGQQQSSAQAAASGTDISRGGGMIKQKPKGRKSTFSKLKFAALDSLQHQGETEQETKLVRVRRKSFPYSQPELLYRHGVLVPTSSLFPSQSNTPQLPDHLASSVKLVADIKGGVDIMASRATLVSRGELQHNFNASLHQVINWEHLPEPTALSSMSRQSNVWSGGSGLFDIEDDANMLQAIAQQFAGKNSTKQAVASTGGKKVSILEPRRMMKISFAMKRMGLEVKKFPKLIWALKDVNESYLTSDAVEILYEAQLWCTNSEAEELKAKIRADGGEDMLCNEDLLLWFLYKSVPDCGSRVQALNFRYEFESQVNVILQSMAILRSACAEICSSQLLKRLMRVILFVGNSINPQPASGIALQSLMHLNDYKSPVQPSISFLDCIVAYLDVCAPEVFEVSDEIMLTEKAACDIAPLVTQMESIRDLKKELVNKVKPIRGMVGFFASATEKLALLDKQMVDTKQAFERCLEHFCLAPTSMDNVEFFGTMFEFLEDFNDAIDRLRTYHEMQKRKTVAEAAKLQMRQKQQQQQQQQDRQVRSGLQNPHFMSQRRASVAQHQNTLSFQGQQQMAPTPRSAQARLSVFGRVKSVAFARPLSIGKGGGIAGLGAIGEESGEHSPRPVRERPTSGRQRPVSFMMTMHELQDSIAEQEEEQQQQQQDGVILEAEEEEEEEEGEL